MIAPKARHLQDVADAVSTGHPFAFSRWGDGEWSAVLGHGTQNCDQQEYTEELRHDLRQVLLGRPEYTLGMQALALRRFGEEIISWLEERKLSFLWVDSGVFHRASARDQLGPLLAAMRSHEVLMVGPERLRPLGLFAAARHVVVPDESCYDELERLTDETFKAATRMGGTPLVALSAGMASNLIIDRLHEALPQATLIDFGSVWEPYVGVANRRYHRQVLERLAT
jgi:hypothetical protein